MSSTLDLGHVIILLAILALDGVLGARGVITASQCFSVLVACAAAVGISVGVAGVNKVFTAGRMTGSARHLANDDD